MLSLRVFTPKLRYGKNRPSEVYLLSVMGESNRASHLGYLDGDFHFWKRVRGEWVIYDEDH